MAAATEWYSNPRQPSPTLAAEIESQYAFIVSMSLRSTVQAKSLISSGGTPTYVKHDGGIPPPVLEVQNPFPTLV
jgi:hypothetical protein